MAKKNIKFTLDTIDSRYSPVGTVKQLDSVFFYIKITENGVTKDLTGQTIKLFAIKEDKKIVEQTTKINITNQSEGLVEIELLNAAIQVHGFTYFELEISDSNGIISTADFILRVNKRVASNEAIESTNEVSTLKKVETYIAKAKVELEEFKKLQNEILATNGNVNTQEALRVAAELKREEAELKREEAESSRGIKLKEVEETKFDNARMNGDTLTFYAKGVVKKSIKLKISGGETGLNFRDPLPNEIFTVIDGVESYNGNIIVSNESLSVKKGESTYFTVKLDKPPVKNKIVTISKDTNDANISTTSLTFTTENYNIPQTVNVTTANDGDNFDKACILSIASPGMKTKTLVINIINVSVDEPPIISGLPSVVTGLVHGWDFTKEPNEKIDDIYGNFNMDVPVPYVLDEDGYRQGRPKYITIETMPKQFSFACKVKLLDDLSENFPVLSFGETNGANNTQLIYHTDSKLTIYAGGKFGKGYTPSPGQEVVIVIAQDNLNNITKIFIDGNLVKTINDELYNATHTFSVFVANGYPTPSNVKFKNLFIWNKLLTDEEAKKVSTDISI